MNKASVKVGFAVSNITPSVGVELCGFGWYINRVSQGIIEPLYANAMVWQTEEAKGAIVSCDLIGIPASLTHRIRELAQEQCGIPYDHILIAATHTHSGPATKSNIGWGEVDEDYVEGLPAKIVKAIKKANEDLKDASFEYGEIEVQGISYNREDKGGPVDRTLKVVKVLHKNEMIGFLAHYSCHPVVMCEDTALISGDFVGMAINKIKAKYKVGGLFLQGSIGDQNPVYCHKGLEESLINLRILSDKLAAYIDDALKRTSRMSVDAIAVIRKVVKLPLAPLDQSMILRNMLFISALYKEYDQFSDTLQRRLRFEKEVLEAVWDRFDKQNHAFKECELQGVRFGEWVLLSHPTELFYRFHQEILKAMEPYKTFIVGFGNDSIGYIPTPDKYVLSDRKYSYPAYFSPLVGGQFPYVSHVGEVLTAEMVELGKQLMSLSEAENKK